MDTNIDRYYVPLENARVLLAERQAFRRRVERFWHQNRWGLPPLIPEVPAAGLLLRQLASFRYEDAAFVLLCERAGLCPVWPAWCADVVHSQSSLKQSYLHPRLCCGRQNKRGELLVRTSPVLTEHQWVGKPLWHVVLERAGYQTLVQYHHGQQDRCFPKARRCDVSGWYGRIPKPSRYTAMLSLCVAHAVMFEDYHDGESGRAQDSLTEGRFEPAFRALEQQFGAGPLIVKMPWRPEYRLYPTGPDWREHQAVLGGELVGVNGG